MLPITLPKDQVDQLIEESYLLNTSLKIDLEAQSIFVYQR
jgi:3-isopropylmalate dehydratase small subunit